MFVRALCGVNRCGNQILKSGYAQRIFCNQVNIVCCGIMVGSIQSVRVGKMGIDRADLLRFLIHQLHKVRNAAVSQIIRYDIGCFVR